MTLALNVILFQVAWFACVLGAAHGAPWLGAVVAGIVVAWHLTRAARPMPEAKLVAGAATLGALFETLLVRSGWIRFDADALLAGMVPYFMVALWAVFATTLNVSLRWLRPRRALAALLGAVGGPAAYYSGVRLGAIEFTAAVPALAAIAIGWAMLAPALLGAARRLDGFAQP